MNLLLPAFILFCGIGSAVFASTVNIRRAIVHAIAFVAFMAMSGGLRTADPAWIGLLGAGAAILHVLHSGRRGVPYISAVVGGALAASLAWMLKVEGLPMAESVLLAAIVPAASIFFARRPGFAPAALIEEALLLVFAMGLAIAALPEVLAGWKSALVLNRDGMSSASHVVPGWMTVLSAAAAMLGGCYSLWRHR